MQVLSKDHPLRCQCGKLQGGIAQGAKVTRVRCYCRDCQTYAHALGNPDDVLDPLGGTDVLATLQQHVTFSAGTEHLACLSLGERGILRWYASCCSTPIANTTRDRRLSYVGLVHTCLGPSPGSLEAAFGPMRMAVNTQHAKGKVESGSTLLPTLRIVASVAGARIGGTYKKTPFFRTADGQPVVTRRVLSADERQRARSAV